ncbi:LysM peptidoglycan-binding domain-containing protein [Joostella atrarenae]|uniref:LysM peptidoglycan-binding domain-containing protein n=1 Tax=Joostella atrarenae TaxID=679257 RepID=A0ABS9J412_9FLAO|nr:LysM peptidoglycan-binding domain-containing protein [Joostella atrarenae]MCF8715179.1 LysM peptidoglycan-binding domain-containing protein [Joostella atrarenae]
MSNSKVIFILAFLFCVTLHAQKFETHAVKAGETLESIAKKYQVTPYSILKLNPEVKNGVKANTIVVIPISEASATSQTTPTTTQTDEVERFIEHKAKRKETLYSIAKEYNVSVDDIKRYNKELYSRQLKRNEKIQIPVFGTAVSAGSESMEREGLVAHTVAPKEGPWRIAYEHGITVDSLKTLNPNMKEVLKEGDVLWVPFVAGNNKKPVEVDAYNYYTVLPKEGFYRLKVKLGVTQEEIEALNPEVKADGLKVGMVLKLPKNKMGDLTVNNGQLIEKFSLLDSLNYNQKSTLAIILPFKLDELDFDNLDTNKEKIKRDKLLSVSLDFYTGALMAIDSVKKLGLSVDVKVFDSGANDAKVGQLASSGKLNNVDAIVGPILPTTFNRVSGSVRATNTPVFAPFSNKGITANPNVFQTLPSDDLLRQKMIDYLKINAVNKNVIVIADKKSVAVKSQLQAAFPGAKIINPIEDKFIRLDEINPFLSKDQENWVIVETNSIPLLTNITGVVNSAKTEEYNITLLTTLKGSAYDSDNISNMHLSNLNFHFPTVDKLSSLNTPFTKSYSKKYGATPNRYATRGFDITMDVLLRLGYNKDLDFVASKVSETEYIENKFDYRKKLSGGYSNQAVYIVKYDNLEIKEAKNDANLDSNILGSTSN